MSEKKLKTLNNQLKENIKKLNSEFDSNHQTLRSQIQELKGLSAKADVIESIPKILTRFHNTISPLANRLNTISTNIKELQQVGERFSAADKENLGIISAPNIGEVANKAAATLTKVKKVTDTDPSSDQRKAESQKFIQQMPTALKQFQETLSEIKRARDQLNSAVEQSQRNSWCAIQ